MDKQLNVAVALLDDNRTEPLTNGCNLALKVLANILSAPDEPKYRQLKTTNAKVRDSLWTLRGGRSLLLAAGFVEEGETIVMKDPLDVTRIERAVDAVRDLLRERERREQENKNQHVASVKAGQALAQQQRANMKLGISDDAAARREPGWSAKVSAAAAKAGSSITTATDVGASG
mmetsp:Transcript_11184/g.29127  ORF Transcript_11184/g.29127 Transcript_11184/m.29127 type:complete len:175 (-) Transcript_11184:159-683(-)